VAALAHAGRMGMGKLIPDRLFWARDTDEMA
jgi:hydroxymethylpyrimidine/phosphomethylpyrimidine kinase